MKKIALLLALSLSGCAGGMVPLSNESISTVTSGTTTSIGYVTDASAIKEMAIHKTLQNRDRMVRDTHKNAGMRMGWQAVEKIVYYPGMKEPITVTEYLPTFSYNEQAKFDQKLPTAPSEHPAWRVVENIGTAAIKGTVIGYGINAASDVLQSAVNSAGHNTTDSYNTADSANSDSSSTHTDYSDNSYTDNGIGPVDNSNNSDNSDNSDNSEVDNSTGPVDNSQIIPE